ncbi:MAG TPA: VanW family protein [Patescibacteria group bacterium]|nr:VanW family protein [Patescibacteria group bacterium]
MNLSPWRAIKKVAKNIIKKIPKENKEKRLNWLGFVLVILLGTPLAILSAYLLAFKNRAYPRVTICQTPLLGKSQNEVFLFLTSIIETQAQPEIILTSQKQNRSLNLSSLQYQPTITTQKIIRAGRGKFPLEYLKQLILVTYQGKDFVFDFQIDEKKLEAQISDIAAELYLPAVEPSIKINQDAQKKKTVSVEKGENGQEVNSKKLKESLFQTLACPQSKANLSIPLTIITPAISPEMAAATEKRAELFLNKQIGLKLDDQSWTTKDEEIISFLSFAGGFDRTRITEFAQNLAKTVNRPAEDAAFHFENNRVTLFRPSREGIALEEDRFGNEFEEALSSLEEGEEKEEIIIPVNKTPAKISTGDVNSLGIKELLGRGSSFFYGSISERVHNLNLASLKINGTLIGPGEEFSFNRTLGDVSADTGFKQAYIIKDGRTVLGDGGGVCQVSTTLFRATFNAGLPITERHAHAYRVHYYEDDLGPGFDATVFDPTADLKFKNNTPAHILIQRSINLKTKQLAFEIYGTSDGRKVEISKAKVWDKVPPPPDLYQDDPTLPAGAIKQIDWKAWGAKASFDYKVTRGGEVLEKKTFYSYYKPWQAVYLRGTGQ